jgi:MFS-type transporter involved in bile tolerance (Atg22 family)
MTTKIWIVIGVLCVITGTIKAAGPLVLGDRRPNDRAVAVIALLSPAVIASLIVYQTLGGHPTGLTVDARVVGLAVAMIALLGRLPMLAVITLAAVATALTRLVT